MPAHVLRRKKIKKKSASASMDHYAASKLQASSAVVVKVSSKQLLAKATLGAKSDIACKSGSNLEAKVEMGASSRMISAAVPFKGGRFEGRAKSNLSVKCNSIYQAKSTMLGTSKINKLSITLMSYLSKITLTAVSEIKPNSYISPTILGVKIGMNSGGSIGISV